MNISDDWKYTDIHTHIMPGIDDGASDMDEVMKITEMAYNEGIRAIFATPHYGKWNPNYDKDNALSIFNDMKEHIQSKYDDMDLYIGNELYYSTNTVKDLKEGKASTMAGTDYVLVEFSANEDHERIYAGLKTLVIEGYRPILAHTERYVALQKKLPEVRSLVDMGAYIQVNTRNFLKGSLDKRAAWSKKLLKNDLIHFVASDCHDSRARTPVMKSAIEKMLDIAGKEAVECIVSTNVNKLMANQYI